MLSNLQTSGKPQILHLFTQLPKKENNGEGGGEEAWSSTCMGADPQQRTFQVLAHAASRSHAHGVAQEIKFTRERATQWGLMGELNKGEYSLKIS